MEEEVNSPESLKSKFNSAYFINLRTHGLWSDANEDKRKGAYSKWNGDLDAVWCELCGDVVPESKEDKEFKDINLKLGDVGPIINWTSSTGFAKPNIKQMLLKTKQYNILLQKERFLRQLQNRQGKGTAYDDDSDDFD